MLVQYGYWPLSFVAGQGTIQYSPRYWQAWEKWEQFERISEEKTCVEKETDMSAIQELTYDKLKDMERDQIILLTLALKEENKKLISSANDEIAKKYDERLERLERELNLQKQYERRTSIEISGIPESVEDSKIEDAVINVLKSAEVKVHNRHPTYFDIQAAHRKGKKGVVICKFVNRKFAYSAVSNSSKLKNADVFEDGSKIYVNTSLCPEFGFLHYAVRRAKKERKIHSYRVRHGVMFIRKSEEGDLFEISHANDLSHYGIDVPERRY